MQENHYELIVLKPTRMFLFFLMAMRPDIKWPTLSVFQRDTTAYTLPKCHSDMAVLTEIENHFSQMFRHEVSRWLGDDLHYSIVDSFTDFLCCFKFELYDNIMLMENDIRMGKQWLCIRPRAIEVKLRSSVVDVDSAGGVFPRIHGFDASRQSMVIIKNFCTKRDIRPFVQRHYQPILNAKMSKPSLQGLSLHPDIKSYASFNRYFTCKAHSRLIHLH